eukprot:10894348-Lingulodinium_polyedra.AAC.1
MGVRQTSLQRTVPLAPENACANRSYGRNGRAHHAHAARASNAAHQRPNHVFIGIGSRTTRFRKHKL